MRWNESVIDRNLVCVPTAVSITPAELEVRPRLHRAIVVESEDRRELKRVLHLYHLTPGADDERQLAHIVRVRAEAGVQDGVEERFLQVTQGASREAGLLELLRAVQDGRRGVQASGVPAMGLAPYGQKGLYC